MSPAASRRVYVPVSATIPVAHHLLVLPAAPRVYGGAACRAPASVRAAAKIDAHVTATTRELGRQYALGPRPGFLAFYGSRGSLSVSSRRAEYIASLICRTRSGSGQFSWS